MCEFFLLLYVLSKFYVDLLRRHMYSPISGRHTSLRDTNLSRVSLLTFEWCLYLNCIVTWRGTFGPSVNRRGLFDPHQSVLQITLSYRRTQNVGPVGDTLRDCEGTRRWVVPSYRTKTLTSHEMNLNQFETYLSRTTRNEGEVVDGVVNREPLVFCEQSPGHSDPIVGVIDKPSKISYDILFFQYLPDNSSSFLIILTKVLDLPGSHSYSRLFEILNYFLFRLLNICVLRVYRKKYIIRVYKVYNHNW